MSLLILPAASSSSKPPNRGGGHGPPTPPVITAVNLSVNSFPGGSSSGTVIGLISVTMTAGPFSGTLALTGADASSFQIVGTSPAQLETNGTVAVGSYSINIVATQTGAGGSPFTQPETITGTAPTISGVALSNGTAFTTPALSGTTIDTLTAACSVGICAGATFALATTGSCSGATSNSSFAISGSNLNIGGTTVNAGSYPIGIAVTLTGASNNGQCYPFTLTGSASPAISLLLIDPAGVNLLIDPSGTNLLGSPQ